MKKTALMSLILLLALTLTVLAGCKDTETEITEIAPDREYGYINPDESKAETDPGIVIDGVLDEAVYQNNNWLYLHNDDGGNNVNIAMTSYYGEKGMYFVYDVTESAPIYVNLDRASYMNSCIEMYLAPSNLASVKENSIFEIDMMPTGDMTFKKSDGKYGYVDVITTDDKMAVLGTTTKGGEVNTPECYGYCLELFIPWEYMTWLKLDANAMKEGFVYVNPAHITSNNLNGTDSNLDRLWYFYAQQNGAEFTDVSQYFRFNGEGVIGTVPVVLNQGENCNITGTPRVIPGMNTIVTITPDAGYALTSITVNGKETIESADYNKDGSVTLTIRSTANGVTVSAKAEPVAAGGTFTLSGKISLNPAGSLKDAVYFYLGPNGERPLELDENGNFVLTDLKEGYYVIKAEKEGYQSVNRSIYLNRDVQTELVLQYNAFTSTQGSCWILDEQNNGVIYKMGGTGVLMSNDSYHNFDYSINLKYDEELAKQGASDYLLQQRSGMRIAFSNGKTWHIDLMKEKDQYILQYAKFSGDNSVTNWKTVRVLNDAELAQYRSADGLRLRVMRQGQYAAVWLGDTLLVIEKFDDTYKNCSAKLGMEFWIYNRTMMEIPFRMSSQLPVNVAGSPFHWPAEIWDISNQYNGTFTKFPAPGKDTWLDGKIPCNDITTTCKDLSPEKKDYSMIYIFKFSNDESFRLRLNHTDNDGKFRVQSFAGSTLTPTWKNYYTLTDEQAQKALTTGVDYRVWISGTTAYVYIDGTYVCSIDLSTNINTGKPSGIENATSTVSFRLDGNTVGNTVIPFKMALNNEMPPEIIVPPSEISYNDFTATAYLKYDKALAAQGTTDAHVQQRSGMKISFGNGKNWHVHLMKENDRYIVQYAKMSGDNSVFNWKTAHVLTETEAAQYESAEGIRLQIMRQGRHAALWLGDTLLVIELLGEEYLDTTAKLSAEAWISGQSAADVVINTADSVPVDVAGSPFHWPAEIWDISDQYNGTITKHPAPGKDTWLDSKIPSNDVTTICKDLSPETKDYSMIYIFKFSNNESFRLRLNHTDNDGKFRIQSFANSTLTPAWKNYYTLTDEQAQKALTDGVEYRVWISGTTAYVYIDGAQVCTIDLSANINTGAPSGIENATVTVSFRLDGNTNGDTVIPFKLENNMDGPSGNEPEPDGSGIKVNIGPMTNGTVSADKQSYQVGDIATLTVIPANGYCQKLFLNGEPLLLDYETGNYSFVVEEGKSYEVTGSFVLKEDWFWTADWNLINQGHGIAYAPAHTDGTQRSGDLVPEKGQYNSVSVLVQDVSHGVQKEYAIVLKMHFVGGKKSEVRLIDRDDNGKYCLQAMGDSFSGWNTLYWLTDAENAAVLSGDGVWYSMVRSGKVIRLLINGSVVKEIDLSAQGITAETELDQIKIQTYNFGYAADVPYEFKLVEDSAEEEETVTVTLPTAENGTVTADRTSYKVGDTVTLTVTANAGYSQKLFINGEPLLLDWKTNQYSFVATEPVYEITGSFEKSYEMAPSDANRWDGNNQAHGIITTYYPNNNDSWWGKINGEYESFAVNAKNYIPQADSAEGSGKIGFSVVLAATLDNGKTYGFRIINEKDGSTGDIRYVYTRFGASGSVTGWGGWCLPEQKVPGVTEKLQGDGAEFKLTRTGANTLQITLDGVVLDTYTMDGVTAANKVTSVGLYHYGNKGQMVQIPFALTKPGEASGVQVSIANLTNGTVVADRTSYKVGDTVTLTVTPADGYCQKLYLNGQPLLLDYNTGKYSFVAEEGKSYEVTGDFVKKAGWFWTADWNLINQGHGIAHAPAHPNSDQTGELVPTKNACSGVNVLVKDASHGAQKDYAVALKMHFAGGLKAEVRLIDRDDNGKYCLQVMGNNMLGNWSTLYWLTDEANAAVVNGDGVWFGMTREGTKLRLSINDSVVWETDLSGKGISADTTLEQVKLQAYNFGYATDIPYVFQMNN